MRLRFAAEFGLAPDDVGRVKLRTWHRWLEWQMAQHTREAYAMMHAYRDKNGNENWAEWANKNPELKKRLAWARDTDTDNDG
jgi:hypothetical protein